MPRRSKGPRLWLRRRKGRESVWTIRDGPTENSTGFREGERGEAEKYLADYIYKKYQPQFGDRHKASVPVVAVLDYYAREKAPSMAAPENVAFHMIPLLKFFGDKSCGYINGPVCRQYTTERCAGKLGQAVKATTARRELDTLQAALNYSYKEGNLSEPVPVTKPPQSVPRERWMTRREVAELLLGAIGFEKGTDGRFRRMAPAQYQVARFILIALYTATRHKAILKLRWGVNSDGGWIDLENGKIYRRGDGQRETNKRRTPAPIPPRLLPHLTRWRRMTITGPCEYSGKIIERQKTGFNRARDRAGLPANVTPHILKHTSITWMLQKGVDMWEISGFTGTSKNTIMKVYGHHASEYLVNAANAISWAKHGHNNQKGERYAS